MSFSQATVSLAGIGRSTATLVLDRRMMRDPGADALDALLSALGVWHAQRRLREPLRARALREGWHYA